MTKRKRKQNYWRVYVRSGGMFDFKISKALLKFLRQHANEDCLVYWIGKS